MTDRHPDATLDARIAELVRVPVLLVATDYDGTLSPIVDDPADAVPHREALVALNNLAELPKTYAAVISGRSLADLAGLAAFAEPVHLVGSHGSEFDAGFVDGLTAEQIQRLDAIGNTLGVLAETHPGFTLERKPASIAFHYRNAPDHLAERAIDQIRADTAQLDRVHVKDGKKVIELSVIETSKAHAFQAIRSRLGATAAIFLGDDRTDEDIFDILRGPDVGVKVGAGETLAPFRVIDPVEVAQILARICEQRTAYLEGATAVPIERHAVLSDQRTIALVNPRGSVTWLCVPRIDSSAIFAELLGSGADGRFLIRPTDGETAVRQAYRSDSLVLETMWPTLTVTDFLDCSGGRPDQRAGRTDLVRMIRGRGHARIEFAPRLDFGRSPTLLRIRDGGIEIEDSIDPIVLHAPGIQWHIEQEGQHHTARAEVELGPEPLILELRYGTGSLRAGPVEVTERERQTEEYWRNWASRLRIPNVAPDLVRRSALALRALVYGPSGAICAAGTTSLPETIGGVRNWDYRYCWLRDAAYASAALVRLGSPAEAMRFLDWVRDVIERCTGPDRIQPLYAVNGAELQIEGEISDLPGYRGSRPVRIGNAASRQIQLDVFGPIVWLVDRLAAAGAPLSAQHWRIVEAMVNAVRARWHEPDHGIWEIRKPRRHHTHSKVMCWMTVDRAIHVARAIIDKERPDWVELREQIAEDILDNAWNETVGSYIAAYGDTDLDAATLLVGLSGLIPADDQRFIRTVETIERELRDGPTVYRYRSDDGLPGIEGGFHLCTSWLIDAYIRIGRVDDAMELFNDLVELAGPTGLLSEEYDPATATSLGNFPQAYTHFGIIENAFHLAEARANH